ncbi:MAG: TOBE-like domain-containing protein [Kiritimatiellia bacterium]
MSIEILNVSKSYGRFAILHNVNLAVKTGELVALLGPSGCGKTTLLRIIAGLERPDSGAIRTHGEETSDRPVRDRRVGFVFQHYALFRHMTVFDNIAFGLRARPRRERPPEPEIRNRVRALLDLIQLDWLAAHFPDQLSGGQRQRVALARALAIEPRVLLLDEPFGALDTRVRTELRRWLRRRHADLGVTSLFVTHDQDEAIEVADRIVVMNAGRIEQTGSPAEVYENPTSAFVCRFLGQVNTWPNSPEHSGQVRLVRPHECDLLAAPQGADCLPVIVKNVRRAGAMVRIEMQRTDQEEFLEVDLPRETAELLNPKPGDRLFARPRHVRSYPA